MQKSRNDGVGGIVIAICFAFCAVIARFGNAESWQSKLSVIARALPEAIHKIQSFCYFLLSQKVESPYPIDSNLQSEIPPIRSWLIYFSHCLKSFVLDTSLCNATLSMTKMRGLLRRFVESPRNDGVGRFGNTESQKSKHFVIARKFVEFSWQSKPNLKSRILDCFDFLQKSRNDGVGRFVIARALPEAIQKIKSFCYFLLSQKVESPYPIDSNLQSEIPPIRSWLIYFSHCFKSFALDTSLCNATLSMTNFYYLSNTRNIRLCECVL